MKRLYRQSLIAAVLALWGGITLAQAQMPDAQTLQLLQQGLKGAAGATAGQSQDVPSPLDTRSFDNTTRGSTGTGIGASANTTPRPPEAPSNLERDFRSRLRVAQSQQPTAERPVAEPDTTAPLSQFGYDMLRDRSPGDSTNPTGAVADDYHLGIGDEIVVTLRGQHSNTLRSRIDREGRLVLPDLEPVSAAGRTFGEVRDELESRVAQSFAQTEAFISVGSVRNIGVYVLGEVEKPGVQRLTGLSSVLDALVAAGGVRKTGTLRHVVVTHQDGAKALDLYNVLADGHLTQDLTLTDGDRIFVGTIGPTIAVVGDVRRPAIYELSGKNASIRSQEALALAGGSLRGSGYLEMKIGADSSGRQRAENVGEAGGGVLRNGDILLIQPAHNTEIGGFTLDGHVAVPGVRSLQAEPTISSVLSDLSLLQDNPYLMFAVLQTTDEQTRARHFVAVDLSRIIEGKGDVYLKPNDRLIILGMEDIQYLSSADVQAVIGGGATMWARTLQSPLGGTDTLLQQSLQTGTEDYASPGENDPQGQLEQVPNNAMTTTANPAAAMMGNGRVGQGQTSAVLGGMAKNASSPLASTRQRGPRACSALRNLASVARSTRLDRFASAFQTSTPEPISSSLVDRMACRDVYERYAGLLPFVLEYAVLLQGDVRWPGIYPALSDTPLSKLVTVAGGLSRDVDLSRVEVTRFDDSVSDATSSDGGVERRTLDLHQVPLQQVVMRPGDVARFNPQYNSRDTGPVVLRGEVRRAGVYTIYRGEKLSELLARAGGMVEDAYPLGTVFTRVSVRNQERESRETSARQYEQSLAQYMASGQTTQETSGQVGVLQSMVAALRSAPVTGRVVVESDPAVLAVRPELDTVLEPGDEIIVPKRPNHITVSGEVLSPTSLQFDPNMQPDDYIREAGGLTQAADSSRAFVVFPDGKAQPLQMSAWNYTTVHIPPGSTIVVPRDPAPFEWWTFSKDIADLASKVAISAASLAVINR